tara:strand:- start:123 stop:542 length:420 start_codon:yes stop_codon:yes gene_type:complete
MNGRLFLVIFSSMSILILFGFFKIFESHAKDYVKKEKEVQLISTYSETDIKSLLKNDSRLDQGHLLFKSICYKCHVIEKRNSEEIINAKDYFNLMTTMITQGNSKGMPAYKQRLQKEDIENLAAFLTKIRQEYYVKQIR